MRPSTKVVATGLFLVVDRYQMPHGNQNKNSNRNSERIENL